MASGKPFTSLEYMAPTPDWAVFGSDEKGFNPSMTRVYRNKAKLQQPQHPQEPAPQEKASVNIGYEEEPEKKEE